MPWLTAEISTMSKILQDKRKILDKDWSQEKRREIDNEAKQLRTKLQNAEDDWKKRECSKMIKDEAKTWLNVKKWVGWKTSSQPEQLRDPERQNCLSLGAKNNCRIMNRYYLNKVKKIKETMPEVEGDPCHILDKVLGNGNDEEEKFDLQPVSPEIVLKTAKKMRKTKSMGRDDMPADLFFLALPHILSAVTHLINLSLRDKRFPKSWKISKICPLFKGGDKKQP